MEKSPGEGVIRLAAAESQLITHAVYLRATSIGHFGAYPSVGVERTDGPLRGSEAVNRINVVGADRAPRDLAYNDRRCAIASSGSKV
jgi:hypothetical protein